MVDVEKLIEEVRKFPVLYDQSCEKYRNAEYKDKVWRIITKNLEVEGRVEECKRKWSSVRDQLRRTLQKRKTKSGPATPINHKYKYEDILTFLVPHLVEREGLSNMPKPEDAEEDYEHEFNDETQEDFIQEICQQRLVDEELIIKDEHFSDNNRDNRFLLTVTPSGQISGNENKFARPKAIKRKIPRSEELSQVLASRQLMAYILSEKKAEKETTQQDLVDAFLGGIAPPLKLLNPHLLHEAKGRIFAVVQEMEMRQLQINAGGQDHLMSDYETFTLPSSESSSSVP